MARSMKRTEVEETVNPIEADVKVETAQKPVKKKFAQDEDIICRAVLPGRTHLLGKRTNNLYTFLGKDDEIGIEYRDLAAEVREGTKLIFRPMIIVEDNDFIKEFPKLKKFYDSLYPTEELEELLQKPADVVQRILPTLPVGIQESMKGLAADMVRTGRLDSVSVIKVLDDAWGTQLSLLTGLFEDE